MPVDGVVDVVVEEVADNLEEIAEATRRINTNSVGFFIGGLAVGAAVGFYFGYKFNKEKIRAEVFKESEEEVEKIRELYQQKAVANVPKPPLEEIIEEQGYERPLTAPVPGIVEPVPVVVIGSVSTDDVWDYAKEIQGRLAGEPYVIHQDEFMQRTTGYTHKTYTYYAVDDVLIDDESNHPLPHADLIVGLNNLKFGHGTDDGDVVFVRNDARELEMEICRTNRSYEEEVLGIDIVTDEDDDDDDN